MFAFHKKQTNKKEIYIYIYIYIYTTTIKGKLFWPKRKAKYATHEQEIIKECGS